MGMIREDVWKGLRKRNVVVLNVLPEDEFLKLHIRGSYNHPLSHNRNFFAEEVGKSFGNDKLFITYSADITCAAGPNAAKALRTYGLMAQDYPGGIKEWLEAGFPVEGTQSNQLIPSR